MAVIKRVLILEPKTCVLCHKPIVTGTIAVKDRRQKVERIKKKGEPTVIKHHPEKPTLYRHCDCKEAN
jgi:hypothetical protein